MKNRRMDTPHPALVALGGGLLAAGLAAFVGLSPQPTPALVGSAPESHDHHTYYAPINTPYTTAVSVCLDRPGRATITQAEVVEGSPTITEFGPRGDAPTTVTHECADGHGGEHDAPAGQSLRLQLAGESPGGARGTTVRLRYTVDGADGEQETTVDLPAMHHRPT